MSGNTFDMNDLRRDFARSVAVANKSADASKTKKMLGEVVAAVGVRFPGVASRYYEFIRTMRDADDPCDAFRDMDFAPMLMGMDVYTGTGTLISDLHGVPKAEKLWRYMLGRMADGVYPGDTAFIVFRPKSSKALWILTNYRLPRRALVPRIIIPGKIGMEDMTIIKLDNLLLDLET